MPNNTDNEGEFSDISADEEFTPIPLPSTQMTLEDFRKALNSSQEKQQELLNRNKRLRLRISDLESELKLAKRTGTKGRPRKAVDSLLSHDKIVLYGKKYAIVVEPFIDSGIFMKPAPQNATYTSMSDARFSNFSEYKAGSIAELYTYLSNEAEMKEQASGYAPFRDAFVHEVRSETSTALHTIRSCAPVIFSDLNLPGELWPLNAATQRKESILVQSLLLFPEQEAPGIFLPIFYPGLVKDNNFLFMNEYLPKVLRAILFGKESLTASSFSFSDKLLGRKWGIESLNNSMIACIAVFIRYLFSEDQTFVEKGKTSQTNYREIFYHIWKYLRENEIRKTDYYKRLIIFWQTRVFKGLPISGPTDPTVVNEIAYMDELNTAMMTVTLNTTSTATVVSGVPTTSHGSTQVMNQDLNLSTSPTSSSQSGINLVEAEMLEEHPNEAAPQGGLGRGRGRRNQVGGRSAQTRSRKK